MPRQHTKSRLGCHTCKRRKVKCDEAKPCCGNCIRFGVPCDFSPLSSPGETVQGGRNDDATPRRGRGRPRSDWTSWTEQLQMRTTTPCLQQQQSPSANSLSNFSVDDMQLFHNYMANTVPSVGDNESNSLWLHGIPKLGFQHPCILSFILALSAHHLARLNEDSRWKDLAERHSTTALQSAKLLLQEISPENSPALYVVSILVCFTAFAKGPTSPDDLLLVAGEGQVSWLSLLRGVRLIVSTTGWSSIFSGPLAEFAPQPSDRQSSSPPEDEECQAVSSGSEDWRLSLNRVSTWIETSCENQPAKEIYRRELALVARCFEQTFGEGGHANRDARGELQVVVSWIYQVDDLFIEGLKERDPLALVILGHFCVLFATLDRFWFTEGWAAHVLDAIMGMSEGSGEWLAWPREYLRRTPLSSPHHAASGKMSAVGMPP